jgi:hypothetical protein
MEIRPYKLLGETELRALADLVRTTCLEWSEEWLVGEAIEQVECKIPASVDVFEVASRNLRLSQIGADGQWLIVACSTAATVEIGRRLLPSESGAWPTEKNSSLLTSVTNGALADLLQRLGPGSRAVQGQVPETELTEAAPFWKPGSGAAVAELAIGANRIAVLLSPAWVSARLVPPAGAPKPRPISACKEAVGRLRLELEVRVGEVELELELLQTIGVGDVIQLDTRVDQPLEVRTTEGPRVCNAYLGYTGGHKCIQLTQ